VRHVSPPEFHDFLVKSGIRSADPKLGIGHEMSFVNDPLRLVVVHFAKNESSEYISGVFTHVLALDKTWYIVPRYGNLADLHLSGDVRDAAALHADQTETEGLLLFLVNHFEALQKMRGNDLYLLAGTGRIIVAYDHHSPDEGLAIYLNDALLSGQLLMSLNQLGAELELFSKRG
jgi:hypothetical protein